MFPKREMGEQFKTEEGYLIPQLLGCSQSKKWGKSELRRVPDPTVVRVFPKREMGERFRGSEEYLIPQLLGRSQSEELGSSEITQRST